MRKILHTLMLVVALAAMSSPAVFAQRHQGAHGNDNRTERRKESARPAGNGSHNSNRGQSGRPGVGASGRPSVGSSRPASGSTRPSSVGNNHGNKHSGNRPGVGNRPGNSQRPGVGTTQRPVNNRPGNSGQNVGNNGNHRPSTGTSGRPGVNGSHAGQKPGVGHRPSEPSRPGVGHHPSAPSRPGVVHRPSHKPAPRPPMIAPPHRPYRPVIARPHYRPTPPPAWRPRRGLPVIRGILGLTFGAAFNVSLDYLYNSGYTVDGYGNNIVYLRNVPAMNYIWTDGALYYGNRGLDASSFYYSTPVYDLSRYNAVYSTLVNTYGVPVSVNNSGGMMTSTWFGGNNGYITLSFGAGTAGRFLTTLTLGL